MQEALRALGTDEHRGARSHQKLAPPPLPAPRRSSAGLGRVLQPIRRRPCALQPSDQARPAPRPGSCRRRRVRVPLWRAGLQAPVLEQPGGIIVGERPPRQIHRGSGPHDDIAPRAIIPPTASGLQRCTAARAGPCDATGHGPTPLPGQVGWDLVPCWWPGPPPVERFPAREESGPPFQASAYVGTSGTLFHDELYLVAAYSFDEGSGTTVADASGNGNRGRISGATCTSSGWFGKALVFDGVHDWVTITDAPSLDLTTGTTLEDWVRPPGLGRRATNGWRAVIIKQQLNQLVYALYANSITIVPVGMFLPAATSGRSATRNSRSIPERILTQPMIGPR
jgi:hypothetical protein